MTRYTKEHKERTRRAIVAAATPAFRASGVAGVGVGEVMGQIGLTHGGFYAHFASKEALVAATCAQGIGETIDRLMAVAEGAEPGGIAAAIAAYLSPQHRDNPADGCPIPALAADIARSAPPVRGAFTAAFADLHRRVAALLPRGAGRDPDADALALIAGLAGAILVARALDDPALSDRTLAAARASFTRAFADAATD